MSCVMMHAGRLLLTALHVPLRHDLYVAAAGCYALWAIAKLLSGMRSLALSPNMAGVRCTMQSSLPFCNLLCPLHEYWHPEI